MPLKINENNIEESNGHPRPEPIVHKPREGVGFNRQMTIWIVIVIVLIVAIVALLKMGTLGKKSSAPRETAITQGHDTAATTPAAAVGGSLSHGRPQENETVGETPLGQNVDTRKPEERRESKSPPEFSGTGQFTIYIGRYESKTVAEEEVGHWKEAGYESFVSERPGKNGTMFAVGLGRFATKEEAHNQAEKFKDGFDGGYWVDVVK